MSCSFNACEEEFLGKIQILLIKFFTDIKKITFHLLNVAHIQVVKKVERKT